MKYNGNGRSRRAFTTSLSLLQLSVTLFRCGLSVSIKSSASSSYSTSLSIATQPPELPMVQSMFPSSSLHAVSRNNNNQIAVRVDVCALNACEAYVKMRDDLANTVRPINEKLRGDGAVIGDKGALLEARLQRLDRRLRSVEQPGESMEI